MNSKRPTSMGSGEEESCVICFGEEGGADVYFSPCSHKACRVCVTKLRVANVYKADKGVRCPICRQVIEGYLEGPAARREESGLWHESEKPAVEGRVQENLYGRRQITSIGNVNDYVPPKGPTGGLKMVFRQDELHPGYIVPPLKPDADVMSMALDKTGARHLDHMLREGYAKRHKVAKMCRDILTPIAGRLAVHGYGNFVLQRMLDYAAEHRAESGNSDSFFTAIVRSLCRDNGLAAAGKDSRGTFSAQKMLLLMQGAEEVKIVIKALSGLMVQLSLHPTGIYVTQRLVEALVTSINCPAGQKPRVPQSEAVKLLAVVCSELTGSASDITKIGIHQVSGPMLVECIRWSLPEPLSLKAAMDVVAQSKNLIISRFGNRTLQGMLSLECKQVADGIIHALGGKFTAITLDYFSWGWKLVRSCLATPCVDDATRMFILDELIDSLVGSGTEMRVIDTPFGWDTLAFGLAMLNRRCLDERLDRLQDWLSPTKFYKIKQSVEQMRKQETPGASQLTIDFKREDNEANDPWAEEEGPGGSISKAVSDGSLSELSVEANSDWEQYATYDDAESSSRAYTPPHLAADAPASRSPSPPDDSDFPPLEAPQSRAIDHPQPELTNRQVVQFPEALSRRMDHPQPEACQAEARTVEHPQPEVQSRAAIVPAPIQPPSMKAGTYTPPHVRQALGLTSNASKAGASSFGVIGGQRRPETPTHQRAFCVVCATDEVTTVFLDCSHMCCCASCAYVVTYCPACHSQVRQVVEVKPVAGSSAPPVAPPGAPAGNLPYASSLLPSDLINTISLQYSPADTLPDLIAPPSTSTTNAITSKYSFAQQQMPHHQQHPASGLLHHQQHPQPHPHPTFVARKPYRPPDLFR